MAEALALIGPMLASGASAAGGALASAGSWAAANAPLITGALTAGTSLYSGIRANQSAKAESKILKAKGDDEKAIGALKATRARKEAALAESRARAVAAGSGGSAGDPTVTNILGGIMQQGEYNSLTELYRGDRNRADLYGEAGVRRQEGRDALTGSVLDAGVSLYSGFAKNRRQKRQDVYYED